MPILLSFFVAFLGAIKIQFVGELTAGEILLLAIFPFQIKKIVWLLLNPVIRRTLFLGLLYLIGLVGADIYRQTAPGDFLRGWAKLIMMLFAFVNIAALIQDREARLVAYLCGLMAAPFLSLAFYGQQWELYKFYLGTPISMAAFLAFGFLSSWNVKLASLFPVVASFLAFFMNSRALAGTTMVGVFYSLMSIAFIRTGLFKFRNPWMVALILLVGGWITFAIYNYAAPRGLIGETSMQKYESQSNDQGRFDILKSRNEVYYVAPKIWESPLIGWGSWARDPDYVYAMSQEFGLLLPPDFDDEGSIPTHSHILGGWLEAGILGAIFWLVIMWRSIRLLLSGIDFYGVAGPLIGFLTILFLWDIFFSPFGGERRLQNGFMLWILTLPIFRATSFRDLSKPELPT